LVYSHIWLNLPRDDSHFGFKQKLLEKELVGSILLFIGEISPKMGILKFSKFQNNVILEVSNHQK
jgi:hypothetical protein